MIKQSSKIFIPQLKKSSPPGVASMFGASIVSGIGLASLGASAVLASSNAALVPVATWIATGASISLGLALCIGAAGVYYLHKSDKEKSRLEASEAKVKQLELDKKSQKIKALPAPE
ncbi:hypothetical protein [Pelagibius sp.]|uniref:hypothetical protein n=1 Tax=Pelagibius sp. TaxID=1931238 RepID=UPI00260D610F|nr:hypothetical protein [Pelagibius sp.]